MAYSGHPRPSCPLTMIGQELNARKRRIQAPYHSLSGALVDAEFLACLHKAHAFVTGSGHAIAIFFVSTSGSYGQCEAGSPLGRALYDSTILRCSHHPHKQSPPKWIIPPETRHFKANER